ncbi:MAG: IS110 family transposase [Propionibacteriaceae bacterium]|nr:MAG: IS110 family transposase [Propionibacteriaceae bacterium]
MTSMTTTTSCVTGGVDTHGRTHHAAVLDHLGRQLGDREFPASPAGYAALLAWLRGFGDLERVGVEGTGTYGVGLARRLRAAGVVVVEVDRPDRRARRAKGKSDPLDAYAAARAALSGAASTIPKRRDGQVEAIRALRVARSSAVKARSQATNQIKALLVTGPEQLREQLRHLSTTALIATCAKLRPGADLENAEQATKLALRRLARRHQHLSTEIREADHDLDQLIGQTAPTLLALPGVGTEVAGQLLTTAGDNPERILSEAAFAHLCGAAPIPASSGRTHRHRLNRGGDRNANRALYVVVLGRLRYDPRTRAYVERRTHEGLSKPEIIRCLKRYVAREIYHALPAATG